MRHFAKWLNVALVVACNASLAVIDWKLALLYAPVTVANVVLFVVQVWDS